MPSFIFNFNISPTQAAISLDGDGDPENPYKITCTADLKTFADWVNSGNTGENKYFELTNNISGAGIPVIGSLVYGAERRFKGTFDGNGFSISNVNRTNNSTNQQGDLGLFGYLEGTVRNLIILNGTITLSTAGKSVGAIAGSTYGGAVIERCFNSGCTVQMTSTRMDYAQVGGLVGAAGGNTTIRYSGNSGTVTNSARNVARAGGIMGVQNEGTTTITECFNAGSITAGTTSSNESFAGGIIGQNGTVSYCYNTGSITANARENTSSETISLAKNDYAYGTEISTENYTISKNSVIAYAGGIVGHSNVSVSNSYNTGSISGGKTRVTVTNSCLYEIFISAVSSSSQATTVNDEMTVSTTIKYDEIIYFSQINGNVTRSSSTCYGTSSNLINNFDYTVTELDMRVTTVSGRLGSSTTTHSITSISILANRTNTNYASKSIQTKNKEGKYSTIRDSHLTISFSGNTLSFGIVAKREYSEGKDSVGIMDISVTCFSGNFTRAQNYTTRTASNMQSQTFANILGSSIWGYNTLINNGRPYLKNTMWTSGAQSF